MVAQQWYGIGTADGTALVQCGTAGSAVVTQQNYGSGTEHGRAVVQQWFCTCEADSTAGGTASKFNMLLLNQCRLSNSKRLFSATNSEATGT